MALPVNALGDNPQQPGIAAETYIPDQLIAGRHPLISDNCTLTGGAALQRGSLLGRISVGTIVSSTGKAYATGTAALTNNPVAGDTLVIAGTTVTFVAANPYGNQVLIGATAAATALNLLNFLVGSTDANLIKCSYSLSSVTITLTAQVIGTGGNSLTLTTNDSTNITVSGATLSGGSANTGTATIGSITAGARMQSGKYSILLTSATQGNVSDPQGNQLGVTTMGSAFSDPEINFTITTGGSPAAGDSFIVQANPGSGKYQLAVATAVDGSQNPIALLGDYVDASAGDVTAPIYIAGEFNVNAMTFGSGINPANVKQQLAQVSIFLRTNVNSATDPN